MMADVTEPATPPAPEPAPSTRRRPRIASTLALQGLVLLIAVGALLLSRPEPAIETIVMLPPPKTPPAAVPVGNHGQEWYQTYGIRSWAGHVLAVNLSGPSLMVLTDLTSGEDDIALAICRAGAAHVAEIRATRTVWVSVLNADINELATDAGGACRPTLQ